MVAVRRHIDPDDTHVVDVEHLPVTRQELLDALDASLRVSIDPCVFASRYDFDLESIARAWVAARSDANLVIEERSRIKTHIDGWAIRERDLIVRRGARAIATFFLAPEAVTP